MSARGLAFALGPLEAPWRARVDALEQARFADRLAQRDPKLWGDDPAHVEVARRRLGWLNAPVEMAPRLPTLFAFAGEVVAAGFTHAVLLGMGGSSLAPEVMRGCFGLGSGQPELTILDDTAPEAVRAIATSHDPKTTLFVVASKSGSTIEVSSFERYFHAWVAGARGGSAGQAFVAITDPGTALERLAAERGYGHVFLNAPDIGGRYSALSHFGLVPAALIGADVTGLVSTATSEPITHGLDLGAALGEAALAVRDKLTLVHGPELAPFGDWVEQLVAESTGKSGRGIVPIVGERLGEPSEYGDDRVFVACSVAELPEATERALERLAAAGHPVIRWRWPSMAAMGAAFMRWEIATVVASAVLGVDPFDEPNVTEAKEETLAVLERGSAERIQPTLPSAARDALAALLAQAKPGDYVALLAYFRRTAARDAALGELREALRAGTRLASTVGHGPRFLHSTGQLHKGGPNTGLFIQITADDKDLTIPGAAFDFAALQAAQAAGDRAVLARRGRRLAHLHLGGSVDEGLDALVRAVTSAPLVG